MKRKVFYLLVLFSMSLSACASAQTTTTPEPVISKPTLEASMSLQLTSDAFSNGQSIPAKYSCIGKNISPALTWTEPPAGTQSYALIMDDPDAPGRTWVHWVLFNIQADIRTLQETYPSRAKTLT
jgi:phosphatidylethanolamine-binding protein (PEBP) family uncharacterized protein